MVYFIYDLETLFNCFTFTGKFHNDPRVYVFEISDRKNERTELLQFLSYLENLGCYMVGYNNLGFDYPILHNLLNNNYTFTYTTAYNLCQQIIGSQTYGQSPYNVSLRDRKIPQIDLIKINHFDNINRRTPLKSLQVAMRLESVEDMPVELGVALTSEQMDDVLEYNLNDVVATEEFLNKCLHLIDMRKELLDNGVISGDVLNFSDVKVGTEYLIKRIGRAKCFVSGSTPKQTLRDKVIFKEIILPKIFYRTDEFNDVLAWFKEQVTYTHKDAPPPPKLEARLAGLDFHFGVGGVHASVSSKSYISNDTHIIKDIDVTGMYVAVGIANGFAPEHLGEDFTIAYKGLQTDRARYAKGTAMNATLKLAGNGAFGNSDNPYSCFYDPKYPKSITVNGQLQILQLVEILSLIPRLEIIQANTDGITVYLPRDLDCLFHFWKADWERETGLTLEEVDYSGMWIRDVNNYLCKTTDGKIKRKGAYQYPVEAKDYDGYWNKDYSMMVVPKVAEQMLINDLSPQSVVKCASDMFDFMIRYKTPAGAKVFIGDKMQLKTVRYYVSTKGEPMKKIAKPKGVLGHYKRKSKLTDTEYTSLLAEIPEGTWDARIHTANKARYAEVTTSIESGRLVKQCNNVRDFDWTDVDFDYYVNEIEKLRIGVQNV